MIIIKESCKQMAKLSRENRVSRCTGCGLVLAGCVMVWYDVIWGSHGVFWVWYGVFWVSQ